MGMFDYYEPSGSYACPVCGTPKTDWQGKDGPCLLLVFREGVVGAVEHRWGDDETRLSSAEMAEESLPEEFILYAGGCDCPYPYCFTKLLCFFVDGVWQRTELYTGSEADRRQRREERRVDWKARLRWLDSGKV